MLKMMCKKIFTIFAERFCISPVKYSSYSILASYLLCVLGTYTERIYTFHYLNKIGAA